MRRTGIPRLEISAGVWRTAVEGQLQSGVAPVDLRIDLALGNDRRFYGTALIRVAGKHRIVLEGNALAFSGNNLLSRTITYNNRTYRVQDVVASTADLTYFFAGYQWDFIARRRGNLGLRAGGAYLDASGTVSSATTGIAASAGYRIGLPLLGLQSELFLIPRILEIHGDLQGMPLGGYGRYVQGGGGVGVHFGPVGLRAAYRIIDADVHERGEPDTSRVGVAPRITGPVFSMLVKAP